MHHQSSALQELCRCLPRSVNPSLMDMNPRKCSVLVFVIDNCHVAAKDTCPGLLDFILFCKGKESYISIKEMICFMIVWLIKYQTQLKAFVFQHFCMNQLEHSDIPGSP